MRAVTTEKFGKMPRRIQNPLEDDEEPDSRPKLSRKNRFGNEPEVDDSAGVSDFLKSREQRKRIDPPKAEGQTSQESGVDAEGDSKLTKEEYDDVAVDSSSPLLKRGRNSNRFDKEDLETKEPENSDRSGGTSILSVHSNSIPWISFQRQMENEKKILFYVDQGGLTRLSSIAQSSLREQGLYVSRYPTVLPHNIDRAILRSRVRSELSRWEDTKLPENGKRGWILSLRSSTDLLGDLAGSPLRKQEMIYIVPFEPFKDRACRPSMRYDPTLPYMQFRSTSFLLQPTKHNNSLLYLEAC